MNGFHHAARILLIRASSTSSGFTMTPSAEMRRAAAKLVVELDGAQHLEPDQSKYDAQRTRDLEQQRLKVLRFDDRQVLLQTEDVLETMFQAMKNPSQPLFAKGSNRPWERFRRRVGTHSIYAVKIPN